MKVSKIFHWLYAFLMTLPIFSVLFVCAYVSLNPNAKDSYSGNEIQYRQVQYQTNEVNSIDDLVVGNVYKVVLYDNTLEESFVSYVKEFKLYNTFNYSIEYVDYYNQDFSDFMLLDFFNPNYISLYFDQTSNLYYFDVYNDYYSYDSDYNFFSFYLSFDFSSDSSLYFIYTENDFFTNPDIYFINNFLFGLNDEELSLIPTKFEEVEVSSLDNAFYYSVNQINENPLFSWAQHSFLVDPLNYITGLFGLSSSSPIVTMLSYWLTISIVWLVFDLVMYIPLLVHRWLDKGIIE